MSTARHWQRFVWVALVYAIVIALALYPGLHEGFAGTVILWNCVPPTIGFVLIIIALRKSKRRLIVPAVFAALTAAVTIFFFGTWFFTPLDTDPHSSMTTLVFTYAPILSLALATIGAVVAWLLMRPRLTKASK
jgi:hypothetical protein